MTTNIFKAYYRSDASCAGVQRRAAQVLLTADSEAGQIRYTVSVSFFPHEAADDFRVTYDAYAEETVYSAAGRRSKKREAMLLEKVQETAEALAEKLGGKIDFNQPLP